uniref:Uncharacterized protein n=1 Tax=uncultured delta proteobacterium HF0070_10I02 TaxID=710824 RepID=E0XS14_9DELT|nr:hypothetical protein [uncultured delta proteobacterium HF0070_10I02]
MADFRLFDAFLNQPLGTVLFVLTALSAIVAGLEIVSPQKRWLKIVSLVESNKSALIVAFSSLFFGSWLYKIVLIREMFTSIP